MALYSYLKEIPSNKPIQSEKERFLNHRRKKIFAGISFIVGFVLILAVIFPLINYQFFYAPKFSYILSPVPEEFRGSEIGWGVSAQEDYTNINTWFKQTEEIKSQNESLSGISYLLSIPKLGIRNANVIINGQDLSKSLVHYPQTALPGQLGNAVILGHSVLPQFFNPNNYLTIFSLLYQMDIGDQILINFDGVEYSYRVEEIFGVKPTDLSPLRQRFDDRFLTLITCSPPGTYLRRLIVKARIDN